ncbi:MAG: hypothetical protein H0Z28_01460 [Archaeoglobus sp.]|nr:hypothetical protein [Archaeoglobus sp.]
MKKLIVLFVILAIVFASGYLMFFKKNELPILPKKTENGQEKVDKGEVVKETSTKKNFTPIHVTSAKGLELWYNGFEEGIVNSFPSYVITDTSDFLVYNLDYNDKSIVLTWEQKRGTLNWINLKIFRYEKLVFNKTSNESKGKLEYVHNDPKHHHSPSVSYSFEKKEPGILLYFNLTNKQNNTIKVIVEKVLYNGTQNFELASENFIFGNVFEILPFQAKDLVLSYPNTTPPHGEITFMLKFPERAGKLSYESLKIQI